MFTDDKKNRYGANTQSREDATSTFDSDFATDADYADGFVESDGARLERESFIPDTVDGVVDDGDEDTDDKEME